MARDGCIYALSRQGKVFKINTNNNYNSNDTLSWALVGNRVDTNYDGNGFDNYIARAIAGIDGCIYWPPEHANRTLQHDPHIDHTSLAGNKFRDECRKWVGGALAYDGVIYCMPYDATQVLAIDPFREFTETLASDMRLCHPEEFGHLFELDEGGITKFDSVIAKFGQRGFQTIVDLLRPANKAIQSITSCCILSLIVATSLPNSALSLIYHLVRQAPELMRRH